MLNSFSKRPPHTGSSYTDSFQAESSGPQGAYVSLETLQLLRHLSRQCLTSKSGPSRAGLGGQHRSRAISRGMEFEEVRQYQPGDDIRTIDWRVTARTQTTHTKRYTEEKEKPIITAVDQRKSMFFGSHVCFKSVYACHLASLINWATLDRGDRCGGLVLGSQGIEETRAVRSHKTVNRWLQQLSQANQQLSLHNESEPPLSELLQQLSKTLQAGAHIIIISDFYDLDKACEQWLFQLSRHHRVDLLWVYDPLESQLPAEEQLCLSQTNTAHEPLKLQLSTKARQEFHLAFLRKAEYLEHVCQQFRLRLHHASLDTPPLDIIRTGVL